MKTVKITERMRSEAVKLANERSSIVPLEDRITGYLAEEAFIEILKSEKITNYIRTISYPDKGDFYFGSGKTIDVKSIKKGSDIVFVSESQLNRDYRYYAIVRVLEEECELIGFFTTFDFFSGNFFFGRSGPLRVLPIDCIHSSEQLIEFFKK